MSGLNKRDHKNEKCKTQITNIGLSLEVQWPTWSRLVLSPSIYNLSSSTVPKLFAAHFERITQMKKVSELKIAIYADGADKGAMLEMYKNPLVKGFTTNPSLMAKSGITDYEAFAREMVKAIPDRPISFEVFSDDFSEMEAQALKISSWGKNVNVKIPISNTKQQYSYELIESLANKGVKLNVTALFTLEQVRLSALALKNAPWSIISVFSGRIADTGRDPVPMMTDAVKLIGNAPNINLLWASPRELLNIFQADEIGVKIITVTNDVIKKLELVGKDMDEFSLETVKLFYNDAKKAGFSI